MLLSALFTLFLAGSSAAVACNGNPALCSRKWSEVSLIGSHDSAFVGMFITDNQDLSVNAQLNAGIRFLQAQTHQDIFKTLSMCHTSCWELDAGPLTSYLSSIKTWLDANPNEVVTLLLTNGDHLPVSSFGKAFASSGLAHYAYTPPGTLSIDQWPTLQELINAGSRLVVFLDNGADTTSVSYILPEFQYFFETQFDVTDKTFPSCALDRPSGSNGNGLMMIVNHFLDVNILNTGILVPDTADASNTNAATGPGSIGAQVAVCENTWGRTPNVVLVDYFDKGGVFAAQNAMNGL